MTASEVLQKALELKLPATSKSHRLQGMMWEENTLALKTILKDLNLAISVWLLKRDKERSTEMHVTDFVFSFMEVLAGP